MNTPLSAGELQLNNRRPRRSEHVDAQDSSYPSRYIASIILQALRCILGDGHNELPRRIPIELCFGLLSLIAAGEFDELIHLITDSDEFMHTISGSHPNETSRLTSLAFLLHNRFCHLGRIGDLEEAISAQKHAVALTPDDHPDKPGYLGDLGVILYIRFDFLGLLEDIVEAISALDWAVNHIPDHDPARPRYLSYLGSSLLCRFEQLGKLEDVERAVSAHIKAVSLTPNDHSDKPYRLGSLGTSLHSRFGHLGQIEDLEKAISLLREAANLLPDDHLNKPRCLDSFGDSLHSRFEHMGQLEDIREAIAAKRHAVALTPEDHPDKPNRLDSLGFSLRSQYRRLGRLAYIEEAISVARQAVDLTPDGHPHKPVLLSGLGSSLQCRFERLGQLDDLGEAISRKREAANLTSITHPNKPSYLNSLSFSIQVRFDYIGLLGDLEEAITLSRQAVRLAPNNHPDTPMYLSNLGAGLYHRFQVLGRLEDDEEASTVQQQAADLTSDNHPDKPKYLNNLGRSLMSRFEHMKVLKDINKAVASFTKAVNLTPDDHPNKSTFLSSLATSLLYRRGAGDLDKAISSFAAAATITSGSTSLRLLCARMWADLSYRRHRRSACLDAYATAMQLIPQFAWLGYSVQSRYNKLAELKSTANKAAATAIYYREYGCALEWLEEGRAVVWGQILQLRTPLDDLRAVAPDLAERIRALSKQLEHSLELSNLVGSTLEEQAQHYRLSVLEYESLIQQVRELPGLEDFMRPKRLSALREAARSHPIVIINVDSSRCDALVLPNTSDPIIHIPLPDLTHEKAEKMYASLLNSLQRSGVRSRAGSCSHTSWMTSQMQGMLGNLWTLVVQPVLEGLKGVLVPSASGELPRITWCGTGPLAFLPIHAAGIYHSNGLRKDKIDNTFHHVVSSYTPTISALLANNRQHAPAPQRERLLVVSQPATPNMGTMGKLPGTLLEVAKVQECIGSANLKWLNDKEATLDAVLKSIESYSWIHLACHATQETENPAKSAFHLYDGPLELISIMQRSTNHAELAMLSACQTAKGDFSLPEEAAHLAAGMLMAGYRSVVGTMWSIEDVDGPVIADAFYKYLMEEGGGDSTKSAYALHHAVDVLRQKVGEARFTRWMPYVHFGA